MLLSIVATVPHADNGYIAGTGDGIVTARGKPAASSIYLLDAKTLAIMRVIKSLENGHYIFAGLNTSKEYVVMCRDPGKNWEPFVWDYVKPADDLTIAEQQALWVSWQNN